MTKTKSYIIGLLGALALAGLFAIAKAPAQNTKPAASCIILGFAATYGPFVAGPNGNYRLQTGLHVTWIERGSGASDISLAVEEPLGQAIEKILVSSFRKENYEFHPVNGSGWMIFTR